MKLVILDRDGVINKDSKAFIKSPDEWQPIPGSLEAIVRLNHAGYQVVVITNQSGLGRGLFDIETLNAIHDKMHNQLKMLGGRVDAILFCPHLPDDHCDCRKPLPGLFNQLKKRLNIQLESVPAIGDSLRDLQAAMAAGALPVLVKTGNGLRTLEQSEILDPNIPVFNTLNDFVTDYLSNNRD